MESPLTARRLLLTSRTFASVLAIVAVVVAGLVGQLLRSSEPLPQAPAQAAVLSPVSSDTGVLPAVPRNMLGKPDGDRNDGLPFGWPAVLTAAVLVSVLGRERATLPRTGTGITPHQATPTEARAPPVAPVL